MDDKEQHRINAEKIGKMIEAAKKSSTHKDDEYIEPEDDFSDDDGEDLPEPIDHDW